MKPLIIEHEMLQYKDGVFCSLSDPVITEYTFTLYVDGKEYGDFTCSDENLEALIIGRLYTECTICALDEIAGLTVEPGAAHVALAAGKGAKKETRAQAVFSPEDILAHMVEFYADSAVHKMTAGVHKSALCDKEGIQYTAIDISRHNAVDKTIGLALQGGCDLQQCCLITSGRAPRDMVQKAVNAKIPVFISRSAPTDEAIELAKRAGVTLIGFAKENRFNIYTMPHRILGAENF